MAYGDNLWYWKHARVGWELGFSLLPVTIKDSNPMSVSVNQTTYTYNVKNSLGIPLPQAPYQGNSSGLGSIIPDTPTTPQYPAKPPGASSPARRSWIWRFIPCGSALHFIGM